VREALEASLFFCAGVIPTGRRFPMAATGRTATGAGSFMARKPNYRFERMERERAKVAKREERAKKKAERAR
jgi:hypothetical protein